MYPGLIWRVPAGAGPDSARGAVGASGSAGLARGGKVLYLTFDDGPHPEATPFVLEQLRKWNARGTFFCIGKNVKEYPPIYRQILIDGHRVGNHTEHHLNGWKTDDKKYIENIRLAGESIDSDLFRPPYGRIGALQSKVLRDAGYKIVMWEVLSGDFDRGIDGGRCAKNVIGHARSGSIVVFHDSEKALPRLREALPRVLEYFSGEGFRFEVIR